MKTRSDNRAQHPQRHSIESILNYHPDYHHPRHHWHTDPHPHHQVGDAVDVCGCPGDSAFDLPDCFCMISLSPFIISSNGYLLLHNIFIGIYISAFDIFSKECPLQKINTVNLPPRNIRSLNILLGVSIQSKYCS